MLSFAGGILGVLMMVPLRRALIVKEHGILPYPEGTACAEVLVAGERGGKLATLVFSGLGIGALWKSLSWTFNIFRQEIGHSLSRTSQFPNATLNVDISPEYMGVGYVIGPRIAGTMVAGGVLSWLVLLPLLSLLGAAITTPFPPIHPNFANNPATGQPFLLSEMPPAKSGVRTFATSAPRRSRRRTDHAGVRCRRSSRRPGRLEGLRHCHHWHADAHRA